MRGGGSLKAPKSSVFGYTLAEIIIVMLIIAVVVSVTIGITKAKLDNIVSYTYYNAYSTLVKISTEMLADWSPADIEYKQTYNIEGSCRNYANIKHNLFFYINNFLYPPVMAYPQMNCIDNIYGRTCCQAPAYPDPNYIPSDTGRPRYCLMDCWDGSTAVVGECPQQIECWDHSYATSISNCPAYVLCQDGSKAYSMADCPACQPPDNIEIPCGQSWNSQTCQLEGVPKVCSNGQHLNDNCECINSCPAEPGCGKTCDPSSGIISDIAGFNRTCSDETYEWSEEQCKCIISPRTLPRKGQNFCKLFERHANIMSGSDVCSGSVISNGTTDFSNKSPDITLRNGLRIYNMHNDAGAISMLANNTQGGVYDGVPNTNSYGYTVYVDIDGAKGDSQLWSDVYPFYITLSGKIIPAYDTSNLNQSGGDSLRHLQVSVENENYNSGKRSTKWLAKSVPFKEGACIAGYVGDATPYCKNGTSFTKASECTTNYNSLCRVKQIQPVKFFF